MQRIEQLKKAVEDLDAVDFGNELENYLDRNTSEFDYEQIATIGREVIDFIESLQK
tara:strand:- start:983 stop:1150 length:168 start_codon:yes stop_codon:yes gene_type:complete